MQDKSVGLLIDELYALRQERLTLDRKSKEMKKKEDEYERELIRRLSSESLGTSGVRGMKASFNIRTEIEPRVTNWDAIYDYIKDTQDFGILGKKVLAEPWRVLYETEQFLLPGTEVFERTRTSLSKIVGR